MKNKILFLLSGVLLLGACRSIRSGDFHSSASIPEKLPALGLLVHERSFLAAFDKEFFDDMIRSPQSCEPDFWHEYKVTDQALEDVFHLLGNDLNENINQDAAEKFGHARFKLLHYDRRYPGWGWLIPSIGTLWTANLFGMPASSVRSSLELQLEITDADGSVLKRYVTEGSGKAYIAMYHGYNSSDAIRKANLLALKDALRHMKTQVAPDVAELTARLREAGPIKKLGK